MNEDGERFVTVTTTKEDEKKMFTVEEMKNSLETVLNIVNNQNYLKVDVIKNCSYVGFMHSFDPISSSIILSVPQGEDYKTVVIPGYGIISISLEETPANIKPPQKIETQTDSTEDILKRKTKLMSWFKRNLLPVTELNNKIILGNVTLLPPYTISDISTDNPIVAMQIKSVIEKMPEDFEPK